MKFYLALVGLILVSCSTPKSIPEKSKITEFLLTDATGSYKVTREFKTVSNKIITRVKLYGSQSSDELESTISVSSLGYSKKNNEKQILLRPDAAQFKVWYNKEQYSSSISIKGRRLISKKLKPDSSKATLNTYDIPKGRYYCFFNQFAECAKAQNLLLKAKNKKVSIYIIWDNYPYHTDQYEGVSPSPFVLADFLLSDSTKDELKFSLDLGNQIIFYHYDKKLNFVKMFWVSQGISFVRKS
jgi:hypothetical protein